MEENGGIKRKKDDLSRRMPRRLIRGVEPPQEMKSVWKRATDNVLQFQCQLRLGVSPNDALLSVIAMCVQRGWHPPHLQNRIDSIKA